RSVPVVAVLGNHDLHADRAGEVRRALEDAGVTMLERESTVIEIRGTEVGIVGLKGFVGGFAGSNLPDFGEPQLRDVYATTTADVEALEQGLRAVAMCPYRIVLLHYAPTGETLEGEPPGIWAFLGSDRLAAPILEHAPDLRTRARLLPGSSSRSRGRTRGRAARPGGGVAGYCGGRAGCAGACGRGSASGPSAAAPSTGCPGSPVRAGPSRSPRPPSPSL